MDTEMQDPNVDDEWEDSDTNEDLEEVEEAEEEEEAKDAEEVEEAKGVEDMEGIEHGRDVEEVEDDSPVEGQHPQGWDCLPYEIHRKILHFLAHDQLRSKLMAEYAVVCKSWQAEIEEVNFRNLTIKQTDIHSLEQIVTGRRRAYLKHLWLKVELDKYSAKLRLVPENEVEQETNNFKFTSALFDLFTVLEAWDAPDFWTARNGRGLNLELGAYSPSDKKHLFGESGLDMDGNSRFFDSLLDFYLLAINDPQGLHGLPLVNAVTGLCILRRNYRNVSATALTPILRSLPRLEEVRFEPWQQTDQPAQEDVDSELASQLPLWPTNLKRVSLFEHFGAFDMLDTPGGSRDPRYKFLSTGLCRLSVNLEELSASFMADAADFFEAFTKTNNPRGVTPRLPHWPNLRWLTLTSPSLSEQSFSDTINSLLRGAGAAAKQMPRLQSMEIWNATRWDAGVFRYLVVNDVGVVSWTSTWDFKLDRAVKTAWRQVALQNTRREPYVFDEVKLDDYSGDREAFIHSDLATRELVLHTVSSAAMMEGRTFPEPVLRLRELSATQNPPASD